MYKLKTTAKALRPSEIGDRMLLIRWFLMERKLPFEGGINT
jgi:hypothetical protein